MLFAAEDMKRTQTRLEAIAFRKAEIEIRKKLEEHLTFCGEVDVRKLVGLGEKQELQ